MHFNPELLIGSENERKCLELLDNNKLKLSPFYHDIDQEMTPSNETTEEDHIQYGSSPHSLSTSFRQSCNQKWSKQRIIEWKKRQLSGDPCQSRTIKRRKSISICSTLEVTEDLHIAIEEDDTEKDKITEELLSPRFPDESIGNLEFIIALKI